MPTAFANIFGFSIRIVALVSGLFRPAVKYSIRMSSYLSLGILGQAWYKESLRSSEYSVMSSSHRCFHLRNLSLLTVGEPSFLRYMDLMTIKSRSK